MACLADLLCQVPHRRPLSYPSKNHNAQNAKIIRNLFFLPIFFCSKHLWSPDKGRFIPDSGLLALRQIYLLLIHHLNGTLFNLWIPGCYFFLKIRENMLGKFKLNRTFGCNANLCGQKIKLLPTSENFPQEENSKVRKQCHNPENFEHGVSARIILKNFLRRSVLMLEGTI